MPLINLKHCETLAYLLFHFFFFFNRGFIYSPFGDESGHYLYAVSCIHYIPSRLTLLLVFCHIGTTMLNLPCYFSLTDYHIETVFSCLLNNVLSLLISSVT